MQTQMAVLSGVAAAMTMAGLGQANHSAAPEGLRFRIAFTQAIDTGAVVAGDPIKAILENSIRDKRTNIVVAPEGSEITARIVGVARVAGEVPSLRLEVRLVSATTDGRLVLLKAEANPEPDSKELFLWRSLVTSGFQTRSEVRSFPQPERPQLGRLRSDPGVYVWEFKGEKPGYVVKAGLQSSWVTPK